MNSTIDSACRKFFARQKAEVDEIVSTSEDPQAELDYRWDALYDDPWEDAALRELLGSCCTALPSNLRGDEEWQESDVAEGVINIIIDACEEFWPGMDESAAARQLSGDIQAYLHDDLSFRNWIGCVPLERRFGAFPLWLNLGPCQIVNARMPDARESESPLDRFVETMVKKYNLSEGNKSILSELKAFSECTSSYVPGRPQLVFRLGCGEWGDNRERLCSELRRILPLIHYCQLLYDAEAQVVPDDKPTCPDGVTPLPNGFVEVPNVALGIDVNTGRLELSRLFPQRFASRSPRTMQESLQFRDEDDMRLKTRLIWSRLADEGEPIEEAGYLELFGRLHPLVPRLSVIPGPRYESTAGGLYHSGRFHDLWRAHAEPVVLLRQRRRLIERELLESVESAILLVSSSLYGLGAGVLFSTLLATEAILNPFNQRGCSERIRELSAALCETSSPDARQKTRTRLEDIYHYRNLYAHQARVHQMWTQDFRQSTEFGGVFRRWDETEPGIFILRVFSKALQEVIRWANELADQGKRCDAAAFEAFRRQALESDR